eukprot:CAMPEP_0172387372 /NCGR_PEP_ID=MMETSP1061-20121228/4681_1 /TAXON_ID=37318 /ORGANISM="Pseudo-nitzschia pungens, Strain cf. pungens" /LENGTH=523 /DNA_ID=CAMNT_0013116983 /DNA_START=145 /DNA_END=1716 /DNA_ORIENTATION=+
MAKTLPFLLLLLVASVTHLSSAFVVPNRDAFQQHHSHQRNPALFSQAKEVEITDVVQEALEKRLREGSLSFAETTSVVMACDALLGKLEDFEEETTVTAATSVLESSSSDSDSDSDSDHANQQLAMRSLIGQMDVDALETMMQNSGVSMDDETVEAAFWSVVNTVDRCEAEDKALPGSVPRMLHKIFDADLELLLQREKQTTNVTCMQPDDSTGLAGAARKMNYIFDDGDHKNLPLTEGRRCEGGTCCDACSRNIFPTFASDAESDLDTFPELSSFTFNDIERVSAASILQFMRLIERVRRTIAHEYGLDLRTILPLQAYSRKYVAGTTQQGGGGGEGDFVILHTDEATHDGYHYSCVLYLSTHGVDFEGGSFVFNDPATEEEENDNDNDSASSKVASTGNSEEDYYASLEDEIRRAGRKLTPYNPTRGAAVIFSSGWENMHEVEKITSGTRYAVPCFFTTCPVPEAAYDQMTVGKPKSSEDQADDWLHLLLAHQKEEPMLSVGRVKELLMKWHYICTPLDRH